MDRGEYNNPLEYEYDMMLVWNNCMTYNQVRRQRSVACPASTVTRRADELTVRRTARTTT